MNEYSTVKWLKGLGKFSGEYNIKIKSDCERKINLPKMVSENHKSKQTLENMVERNIIEPEKRQNNWSNNIVIVGK